MGEHTATQGQSVKFVNFKVNNIKKSNGKTPNLFIKVPFLVFQYFD